MIQGTENNLRELLPITHNGAPTLSGEVDFILVFNSGRLFYTGGQEDADNLARTIFEGKPIFGSYSRESGPWQSTKILGSVETIIDVREDTEDNEPSS